MSSTLLSISHLSTHFQSPTGLIRAVDDLSLQVNTGESIGLVGESGCGKSVLARSIMRLIPDPPGRIVSGEIIFEDQNILKYSKNKMQKVRGNAISMIFQEPMTALNPVYTVGTQLAEVFRKHRGMKKSEAWSHVLELLRMVRLPDPEKRIHEFPFQMSGGMRQRVVIAMALACRPKLILADEPTTALDVTIQAQILELIKTLQQELTTSMVLITHDLGVVAETTQRVLVMYAGQVVEEAPIGDLFNEPLHPYTAGLMRSMPTMERDRHKNAGPLKTIPGIVPDLSSIPSGCRFYERCERRLSQCLKTHPSLLQIDSERWVRCRLYV